MKEEVEDKLGYDEYHRVMEATVKKMNAEGMLSIADDDVHKAEEGYAYVEDGKIKYYDLDTALEMRQKARRQAEAAGREYMASLNAYYSTPMGKLETFLKKGKRFLRING